MNMVDCEGVSLASSCTKLPHSRSAEISKTPPPGAGPKGGGKMLAIRVHMLDDNITLFQVQAKATGRVLFEQVCKQLHLLEADYFGLEYQDHSGIRYWLDLEKQLSRQVGLSLIEPLLHFCVKFYTPDPAQLEEEFTRYLFCLQIKRDLAQGHIQCNDNTAALMASYIVQAECGDYSADDYPDHTYLSSYKFVQHQDRELEKKIMDNHKKHIGQSPAEADLNLLETARRCELYGMKMHPAKDHEGVSLNLAVAHMGIAVFQNYAKIYTFSWAKVRKISFKRKRFLIKLHPDGYGYYKDVVEFFFESRNECKNLWKKCVENHGFFRCNVVKRVPRQRTRVLSRGSSFRYSGKTQKQMVEFVRENYVKRQNFQRNGCLTRSQHSQDPPASPFRHSLLLERSQSFRQSSSVHSSVATNVGGSISARPLIPLGDNSIVSVSCGSMVHVGAEEGSQSRTFQPMMTTNQMTGPRHTLPDQHTITAGLRSYNTASSQTDIVDLIETSTSVEQTSYNWQRSASAKELRKAPSDASYEPPPRERNFIIAGSKTPSFDREAETKVYSSSYPGTTSSLSTESADELEPGGSVLVIDTGSSREFSHDDLSHDSYELLERESFNYVHSRSCSIGSSGDNMLDIQDDEELFLMDDIKDDVDKRLGYVEPKYRDMAFNEFNEKCKQGIARFRERNQVEFEEYEAKCKPGVVIGYDESDIHYPVERTKSEPFVSDFWKIAKQHRKLFHQKSFDYTPTESLDSEDRSVTSKSTVDIPYAVQRRQQMNGTTHCYECRSPVSPRKDESVSVDFDRKGSIMVQDRLTKSKHDADLNSHDSGLSLSLVGESIDDLADKNNQFLKPNDQRYITSNTPLQLKPSLKKEVFKFNSEDAGRNKNMLVKSKAQSADSGLRKGTSFDRNPPVEVIKIPSQDGEGIVICSTDDKNISLDTSDPDVIIVEYHSKRKRAFQKRSSSDGKGSFEKDKRMGSLDSAQPDPKAQHRKFKEWRSESSSSCDNPASEFKRERFSKEIKTSIEGKVVRETREEKELKKQRSEEIEKKKTEDLRKQKSEELQRQKSEEYHNKILRRQEVIDSLKKKHEDLNKIEIIKVGKEEKREKKGYSRLAKPVVQKQDKVIELSPKPEHKEMEKIVMEVNVEINATRSQLSECSDDDRKSESDVDSKPEKEKKSPIQTTPLSYSSSMSFERIKEAPEEEWEEMEKPHVEVVIVQKPILESKSESVVPKEQAKSQDSFKLTKPAENIADSSKFTSPELVWKKFGELPTISSKRERSPILFARLGFSEGSAFAPTNVQSPSSSRRAKSLDAPVVSLQRLPPVTSFSSRDDTVDNEEAVELEEKTLRSVKVVHRENIIEEEDTSSLSPLIQDSNKFVRVIEIDSSQVLPDVVSGDIHKESVACQSVATVVQSVLENYCVALPPCTKMYPSEIIFIEQDQKIPEVTLLSPSYKTKPYMANQLSDEQKVPESQCYDTVDSGGPSEICDDEDSSSFLNDVFEFSDSRKGSDVTELTSISRDAQGRSSSAGLDEHSPRGPSPNVDVTERRPSTRQERLDSFKNTKSYSVDISTESEENENRGIPTVDVEDWDQDDEAFSNDCMIPSLETLTMGVCQPVDIHTESIIYSSTIHEDLQISDIQISDIDISDIHISDIQISDLQITDLEISDLQIVPPPPPCDSSFCLEFEPVPKPLPDPVTVIPDIETTLSDESFDEKPELLPLSSICEKIVEPVPEFKSIPPKRSFDDDVSSSSSIKPDKATLKPFSLESSGSSSLEEGIFPPDDCSHFADEEEGSSNSAKDDYQGFGYSVAGAELVISGYSGGGVFGLSRTLSRISERSTTSEQERSDFDDDISTKPSSRSMSVEDESMMSSDRQPSLSSDPSSNNPEMEEHPLPPLPPEPLGFNIPPPLLQHDEEWPSPPNSSFDTPVISNIETYYMDLRPEEPTKVTISQEPDYDESSSSSEYDNKTLQEEDGPDSSTKESTVRLAVKMKKAGNSSDTSLGISDFSSSTTGTTVKHCSYYACPVKSDDSSLAEFGSSLSTEVLTSSRKNSDDSMNLRRRSYHTPQRSFDDYDSPCSESDESSKMPKRFVNLPSPTGPGCSSRKTPKSERRACKSGIYQECPRGGKSIARAKCYSYYSLAKSPPSDGSSSSLELGEPPSTPNTIPRVSKRRRHVPTKRRQRAATESDTHLLSVSSPSVVASTNKRATDSGSASLNDSSMNVRNTNYNHVLPQPPTINGTILPNKQNSESCDDLKPQSETDGYENHKPEILEKESKKKKTTLDRAYFIGKELLMTERTYKRDLELINLWAREAFSSVQEEPNYMSQLLKLIGPIDDFHSALLKDMEYHFSSLENRSSYDTRLSDLFCNIVKQRHIYVDYIDSVKGVLHTLASDLSQGHFDVVYVTFEKNKVCYLPLTLFILKPLQRLLHYSSLLDRVVDHFVSMNVDCQDLDEAKLDLMTLNKKVSQVLAESENYVQLIELSRDLVCYEGKLIDDDRTFIRQGCLTKFSQKKGYQQRMFFLLSDMLLYCNLVGQKFKVHGQLPLRSLNLEEREDNPSPNSFTMYSEKRAITVCGSSQEEKNKWIKDITTAVEITKRDDAPSKTFFSLKCSNSADDVSEKDKNSNDATPQRSNTTVHVCWHRNTSVCLTDHISAAQNQLSGYLLRKFKNSNGWQKLWVVFTNFCLFFYKTYQDEAPLASLPLLGYSVTVPSPDDGITKEFVFKLQFKNHVYFFRAESQYTFDRWMEVIGSATLHSQRNKSVNHDQELENNNIASP